MMAMFMKEFMTNHKLKMEMYAGPNIHDNFLDLSAEKRKEKDRLAKELA